MIHIAGAATLIGICVSGVAKFVVIMQSMYWYRSNKWHRQWHWPIKWKMKWEVGGTAVSDDSTVIRLLEVPLL